MLPSANFKMTLETSPSDEHFSVYFEDVRNKFSTVIPNGKVTTSLEPLKDEPSKTTVTVKSTKARTQSKIDMDDVTKAFEQKDASRETTTTQVGSIKSIQVQSKKTAVRITTHSTKVNCHTISTTSTSHENEVNTLLNEAQQMVAIGDETYEIPSAFTGNSDDVFVASLTRRDGSGLGLGLIDGMFTSLNSNGIFVRTIVPNTPASEDTRLRVGDRILAVNGNTLVGAGYNE
ncbi:ras-associating and dilute domain-containing protein-like [Clytia hemisphaerica]|uniref:PDZ domain-containing protein n=1 Tax=Clytia hemisphaerica TaxID=252671 RepID=A0A7M6DPZ8_9CNID